MTVENLKRTCGQLENYLTALFKINGIFNIYKLREFFQFRYADLFEETVKPIVKPNQENYFGDSDKVNPANESLLSEYST